MHLVYIAIGGALGSLLRYFLTTFLNKNYEFKFFVLGTLAANVIGCFLIGLFYAFAKNYEFLLGEYRLFFVVGFLGAFTTFSGVSYESLMFYKYSGFAAFSINIILNLLFGLFATYVALKYIK